MTDITKCTGEGCSMKEHCYRFKAPDNDLWQSYFIEAPIKSKGLSGEECPHFWEHHENNYSIQVEGVS